MFFFSFSFYLDNFSYYVCKYKFNRLWGIPHCRWQSSKIAAWHTCDWGWHPPPRCSSYQNVFFLFPSLFLPCSRSAHASWRKIAHILGEKSLYIYVCIYAIVLWIKGTLLKNRVQLRGSDCSISECVHMHVNTYIRICTYVDVCMWNNIRLHLV